MVRAAFVLILSLILTGAPPNAEASSCDVRSAFPSTHSHEVVLSDTLDFGLHGLGGFPDLDAAVFNAGYGRWYPASRPVLVARGNITLSGNVCLDGDVHANGTIVNPNKFRCGADLVTSYTSGFVLPLPAAYTEPDSFPGATYYFMTVTDGPGSNDTLWVQDRNGVQLNFWVSPATPHPNIIWSYVSATKKLVLQVQPTNAFDQVTGPFPRTGGDSTVVVNFGGLASGDHLITDLTLKETGSFEIETTLINARFVGTTCADRLDPVMWVGGNTSTSLKALLAPKNGLALLVANLSGNAQTLLGTAVHPAAVLVTNLADFSSGQWDIRGSLFVLNDAFLGGGVELTYDAGPEAILPPAFRPAEQNPLEITGATFSGPDGWKFSLVGGFQPAIVTGDSAVWSAHMDDTFTFPGQQIEATLTLSMRDAVTLQSLGPIQYALFARRFGISAAPPEPLVALTFLGPNTPNPFSTFTRIPMNIRSGGPVRLDVFDILGRHVRSLVDGYVPAGETLIEWDGRSDSGAAVASGLYAIRLSAAGTEDVRTVRIVR